MEGMQNQPLRIVAVHDLSCFGRASLTVIMPILANLGIQVCPLPTAVFSTHTAIPGYQKHDLTPTLEGFIAHWQKINLSFEAIYSGYLGSIEQITIMQNLIKKFPVKYVVVDPVLGDDGKLYEAIEQKMIEGMRKLISSADIITPNITEAAFLLDEKYSAEISKDKISQWLTKLAAFGPKIVIITGHVVDKKTVYTYALEKETGKVFETTNTYIDQTFSGTGDIFTSIILGSLLKGKTLEDALALANLYLKEILKNTINHFGVNVDDLLIESGFPILTKLCK